MTTAILLVGHGSRDTDAVDEFYQLAQCFQKRLPERLIGTGFLELAKPTIGDAVQTLINQGATDIHALPGMLMAGAHARTDIPLELQQQALIHNINISCAMELGLDANMLLAARQRIEDAEAQHQDKLDRTSTLLLVVGRGSRDPQVINDFNHIGHTLQQDMGFADSTIAYSSISPPTLATCLENAKCRGFKRVMLFPYFLFTGRLVKRVLSQIENFAKDHPEMKIISADYFGAHPKVIDTFIERLEQIPTSNTNVS